jgi:hypothetical protein
MNALEYYELAMQSLYAFRYMLNTLSIRLRVCGSHLIAHSNNIKRIVHLSRATVLSVAHCHI